MGREMSPLPDKGRGPGWGPSVKDKCSERKEYRSIRRQRGTADRLEAVFAGGAGSASGSRFTERQGIVGVHAGVRYAH